MGNAIAILALLVFSFLINYFIMTVGWGCEMKSLPSIILGWIGMLCTTCLIHIIAALDS